MSLKDKIYNNYITINDCKILSVVDDDDKVWLCAKQVIKMLGYADYINVIKKRINSTEKSAYKNIKLTNSQGIKTFNFQQHSVFITEHSFLYLICNSRTLNSINVAKELKINLLEHKAVSKEINTISKILKVFNSEETIFQYSILKYKIDLYFSKHNLAIECDENGHKDRKPENEKSRQDQVTEQLNCQWIRYDPDAVDFDIFDVIRDIYLVIKTK